jgi:hypothetical protein
MKKYIVQHVGYPVAGRSIRPDEWHVYSQHDTASAAAKAVSRARAHLDNGSWDDHYRIMHNGRDITSQVMIELADKRLDSIARSFARRR